MAGKTGNDSFVLFSKFGVSRQESALKPPQSHMLNVANNLKKIKNIFKILFLLLSFQAFSQKFEMKIDSILNLEIAYLKSNGIKEVGYTKLTCIGYGFHSTTYLFWKKENSTFIQKFENSEYDDDSLKKFKPLEITDTLFFNFYRQNKKKLNEETIEHFEYKPDSIVGNITYSSTIMASHSCFRYFIIKSNDENFHKQFDYFDLKEFDKKKRYTSKRKYTEEERRKWQKRDLEISEYEIVHENYPKRNLNFKKNKSLKIVKWDEIMTEYIEKLESENKFKLINIE